MSHIPCVTPISALCKRLPMKQSPFRIALDRSNKTQADVVRLLGVNRQNVSRWYNGSVRFPREHADQVAQFLGVTADFLVFDRPLVSSFDPDEDVVQDPIEDTIADDAARRAARRKLRPGEVVERDVRGGLGPGGHATVVAVDGEIIDGVSSTWTLPQSYLHTELRAKEADVDIIPVDGDSMVPTLLPGDRVMIHRSSRSPSPDGVFAISDGIGISIKRLQLVRGSDPLQVRIISDNPLHTPDVIAASDLNVIGRVICKVTRM